MGRYARCVFTDYFMSRDFGGRHHYLREANGKYILDVYRDRVVGSLYYQPYSYDSQLSIPRRVSVVDPRINNRCMSSICHYYKGYRSLQLLARMVSVLELVGTAIRPISLSLRLVANMSCRHILMALFSGRAPFLLFSLCFCLWFRDLSVFCTVLCLLHSMVHVYGRVTFFYFFSCWFFSLADCIFY